MIYPERENIERWFFDYYEGNLSTHQVEALEVFLEEHPDLIEDFNAWGESTYVADEQFSTVFDRTELLVKKDSRFKVAYALYGIALILSATLFIQQNSDSVSEQNSANIISSNKLDNKTALKNTASQAKKINTSSFTEENRKNGDTKLAVAELSDSPLTDDNNLPVAQNSLQYQGQNPVDVLSPVIASSPQKGEKNSSYIHIITKLESSDLTILPEVSLALNEVSQSNEKREVSSTLPVMEPKPVQLSNEANKSVLNNENSLSENEALRLKIGNVKFSTLSKVLSNLSTGLAYIPDISYALPETSQTDVMISNTGAISQTRYQHTATARWLEEGNQQKISNQLAVDGYARSARMGVGLQLNHHFFGNGALTQVDGAFTLSPKIALTRTISLEPAARLRFGNYRVNAERITPYNNQFIEYQTGDQQMVNYDTSLAIGKQLLYRDLDAGVTVNSSRGYVGIQAENITGHFNDVFSNQENDYQYAQLRVSGIAGTQFLSRNKHLAFAPYVYGILRTNQLTSFVGFSSSLYGVKLGGSFSKLQQTAQIGYQSKRVGILIQTSQDKQLANVRYTHQLMLRFNTETSKKIRRYITL